jgi:UDP-glucose 4-epimerase
MRVLVSGGAGYVGSHVLLDLIAAGYEPVVVDDLSKGHTAAVPSGVPLIQVSLADSAALDRVFAEYRPQAVLHFAGFTEVGESVKFPDRFFRNNISNGINLLDAMVAHQVKMFVFSSTAAVYGEPQTVPIPEDHPKSPTNPYGESKLFFEKILARYDLAYELRSIALRYFNAAGAHPGGMIGEDHLPETHLIPIILQVAMGKREQLSIYGADYPTPDGTCVRDYVHVCDLASAHVLALKSLQAGANSNAFNLGNGQGFSVKEVLSTAEKVVGKPIPAQVAPRRAGDPAVLVASSLRAREVLGWQPKYDDIHTIVETAWRWHQAHPAGFGDR